MSRQVLTLTQLLSGEVPVSEEVQALLRRLSLAGDSHTREDEQLTSTSAVAAVAPVLAPAATASTSAVAAVAPVLAPAATASTSGAAAGPAPSSAAASSSSIATAAALDASAKPRRWQPRWRPAPSAQGRSPSPRGQLAAYLRAEGVRASPPCSSIGPNAVFVKHISRMLVGMPTLYDRERQCESLADELLAQYSAFGSRSCERPHFPGVIVTGSAGSGKTRFLAESFFRLQHELERRAPGSTEARAFLHLLRDRTLCAALDLQQGADGLCTFDEQSQDPAHWMKARLRAVALQGTKISDVASADAQAAQKLYRGGSVESVIADVASLIRRSCRLADSEPVCLFLLIDEYQQMRDDLVGSCGSIAEATTRVRPFFHCLMRCRAADGGLSVQQAHRVFIVLLFGGTSGTDLTGRLINPTSFSSRLLRMTPLRSSSAVRLVVSLLPPNVSRALFDDSVVEMLTEDAALRGLDDDAHEREFNELCNSLNNVWLLRVLVGEFFCLPRPTRMTCVDHVVRIVRSEVAGGMKRVSLASLREQLFKFSDEQSLLWTPDCSHLLKDAGCPQRVLAGVVLGGIPVNINIDGDTVGNTEWAKLVRTGYFTVTATDSSLDQCVIRVPPVAVRGIIRRAKSASWALAHVQPATTELYGETFERLAAERLAFALLAHAGRADVSVRALFPGTVSLLPTQCVEPRVSFPNEMGFPPDMLSAQRAALFGTDKRDTEHVRIVPHPSALLANQVALFKPDHFGVDLVVELECRSGQANGGRVVVMTQVKQRERGGRNQWDLADVRTWYKSVARVAVQYARAREKREARPSVQVVLVLHLMYDIVDLHNVDLHDASTTAAHALQQAINDSGVPLLIAGRRESQLMLALFAHRFDWPDVALESCVDSTSAGDAVGATAASAAAACSSSAFERCSPRVCEDLPDDVTVRRGVEQLRRECCVRNVDQSPSGLEPVRDPQVHDIYFKMLGKYSVVVFFKRSQLEQCTRERCVHFAVVGWCKSSERTDEVKKNKDKWLRFLAGK